jgi:3-hydroxyisobutyrate dehydrogenase-like beta-hydroxyacid dehydrogenase
MLEVPVSGGLPAASAGKLTAMVGGDTAVLERYRPLLRLFCGEIFHLGAPGSGNTAKVITNLLACANTIVAAEGIGPGPQSRSRPGNFVARHPGERREELCLRVLFSKRHF